MSDCTYHAGCRFASPGKILFAALLVSGAALGDDAGLVRCRALSDPAARLACYDALPLGGGVGGPAPSAAPQAPPLGGGVGGPAPSAAPQAPPRPPAEQFGLEGRLAPKDLVEQIDSRVQGQFDGWSPGSMIKLANGQVWQVTDISSRFYDVDSPKVTIARGALGAFYLNLEGDNHTVRVRRVQ